MNFDAIVFDLLLILLVGLVAGLLARRLRIPVVVGYLIGGCLLGPGGFGVVGQQDHEIEGLAEVGVFFLLFSIGLEITPGELVRLGRKLLIGGSVQMVLVAVPVGLLLAVAGLAPRAAALIALAVSFSSTVLVFQALSEQGRTTNPVGRRVIGILLFQDAALVPLLLAVPLLVGSSSAGILVDLTSLVAQSLAFGAGIAILGLSVPRFLMPAVCRDRSAASVVLFSLLILGGVTEAAHWLGLPPVVGAFFAGLILSGSRWTAQIEAVVLPFREAFAVVFFASLGLLLQPAAVLESPLLVAGGFAMCVGIKAVAGAVALRATDVPWGISMRMGMGLAHIGEFAFVLVLSGHAAGVISADQYGAMIAIGLLTLIITPPLFRSGVASIPDEIEPDVEEPHWRRVDPSNVDEAVVIGAGPVGQRVASTLEMQGIDVCVVDISPVNLQIFAQAGLRTVAGDAGRPAILRAAGVQYADLAVVCVPDDSVAVSIVRRIRSINQRCRIIVRCRYQANAEGLEKLGASHVVSEEVRVSQALVQLLGG